MTEENFSPEIKSNFSRQYFVNMMASSKMRVENSVLARILSDNSDKDPSEVLQVLCDTYKQINSKSPEEKTPEDVKGISEIKEFLSIFDTINKIEDRQAMQNEGMGELNLMAGHE